MIRQILNMGKVDNKNPFEILRKVGERFNLEGFLKEGEELPTVLNKLLGKGEVAGMEGLKSNVLFTTSSMMSAVANKQMYDSLARVMLKHRPGIRRSIRSQSREKNNGSSSNRKN